MNLKTLALAGALAGCSEKPVAPSMAPEFAPEDTEIAETAKDVKKEIDWTCDAYLSFKSWGEYIAAIKDCRVNIDVTREIRGIDPSLAEGDINIAGYEPDTDELYVSSGKNTWIVSGLSDIVQELPSAKVTGKKIQ